MLTITEWQVGSLWIPNYHYAMDFDLHLFFGISKTWSLTDDFYDISDLSDFLSNFQTPYVILPPNDMVELIFLLELF